jgi:hypothetical protein
VHAVPLEQTPKTVGRFQAGNGAASSRVVAG